MRLQLEIDSDQKMVIKEISKVLAANEKDYLTVRRAMIGKLLKEMCYNAEAIDVVYPEFETSIEESVGGGLYCMAGNAGAWEKALTEAANTDLLKTCEVLIEERREQMGKSKK